MRAVSLLAIVADLKNYRRARPFQESFSTSEHEPLITFDVALDQCSPFECWMIGRNCVQRLERNRLHACFTLEGAAVDIG